MAWAAPAVADCPDIDAQIRSAESDLLSYFLADAQKALGAAVEGMACGEPLSAEQVARYWQAQAMIWSFQEDERAASAFAASKARGADHFNDDYGSKYRAIWEAAAVPSGAANPLVVRGIGDDEKVWIDGVLAGDPAASAGLHLVQIGGASPRFARAVEFPASGSLTLSVPAPTAPEPVVAPVPVVVEPDPDPQPEPKPDPQPEPKPDPVGPAPEPVGPALAEAFARYDAPLQGLGRKVADAEGRAMSWRGEVIPLAKSQASGRAALRKMPGNTVGQIGMLGVAAAGAYSSYLFGWEVTTGRSQSPPAMTSALVASALVAVTGLSGRMWLAARRKKNKGAIRDAASSALALGKAE
ncbi:MAG: hypothetical protein H6737_29120 [Alphaproteobacteria bacterium]|nr:hypothetical protein [Alphaproteobacteria bacterium]